MRASQPRVTGCLVRLAARPLGRAERARYGDEWVGELAALPAGRRLVFALQCLGAARRLKTVLEPTKKTPWWREPSPDLALLRVMRTRMHGPGREAVMRMVGKAGNNGAVWLAIGSPLALTDPAHREAWLICALLGPIGFLLNYGIKLLVRRPRPVLEGLPPIGGASSSLSYPAGHATASFAVLVAMARVSPEAILALPLVLLISFSRPYLGMQYPSDVVSGAIVGGLLGLAVPLGV
jgi:membrane-associated phospholipid phosphatase